MFVTHNKLEETDFDNDTIPKVIFKRMMFLFHFVYLWGRTHAHAMMEMWWQEDNLKYPGIYGVLSFDLRFSELAASLLAH